MADHSVRQHIEILYDVLEKVANFIFPGNFVILNYEVNFEVPIILGRLFLATEKVLVDIERN